MSKNKYSYREAMRKTLEKEYEIEFKRELALAGKRFRDLESYARTNLGGAENELWAIHSLCSEDEVKQKISNLAGVMAAAVRDL